MNYQMDYFYGHEANQFTFLEYPNYFFQMKDLLGYLLMQKFCMALCSTGWDCQLRMVG